MATLGKIGEYCAASEEWPQYVERLEFFPIANKVTEEEFQDPPVTHVQIQSWTVQDPLLSKVANLIQQGWPNHCEQPELKPYWSRRAELSYFGGCILWGTQVLIPPQGRQ